MSQYSQLKADLSNDNSSITKLARLIGHDRRVLDVGCAHGYLAEILRQQGCRVVGVDSNADDTAQARAHCERVVVCDLEQPGWIERLGERDFEVIVFADVLEHLRNPDRVLRDSLGLLRSETGFIVASIPNVAHVSVRLELLLGSFRREPLGILDATHLQFYTRDSLDELLWSNGLAVDSWDCTTNEVAEHVIADYLERGGLSYTPELRRRFAEPDAMAFQFIVKASPATGTVRSLPPPLEKPLQTMERLIKDHERLGAECQRAYGELAKLRATPTQIETPRDGGLRVLQVVHQFVPRHAGGTEIYCSDLSFSLTRRGHAVRVLSGAPFPGDVGTSVQWEDDAGIVVERLPATRAHRWLGTIEGFFDRFDNPDARQAIRRVLDQMRPDVVHIQHLLYHSAELIPECRLRGIPVVVMLNDYWFLCQRVKLKRRDESLCNGPARGWNCNQCLNVPRLMRSRLNLGAMAANLYRYEYLMRQLLKADRILAPSRFLRDVFERNGVPKGRIQVCDYGTATPPAELAARRSTRQAHDPVRFGFLGALIPEKGLHVLIEAMSRLSEGSAELHIFALPVDTGYEEHLRARSSRHPGIHWRGTLAHPDRWQALDDVDVLVVPSTWHENSPLTIHEALIVGVPVIGSAMGGIPELVEHGVTGLTFPSEDADALAACLRGVIEDPDLIARWRGAIVPPKSMEAHVDEIDALYHELRAARDGRASARVSPDIARFGADGTGQRREELNVKTV